MKPRDVFGIIVRTIGIGVLLVSALNLYWAFISLLVSETRHTYSPARYLVVCVLSLVVGQYLLRGAPQLIWFAYRDEAEDGEDKSAGSDQRK